MIGLIPNTIQKEHILKAIRQVQEEGIPPGRHSTKYQLIHEGRSYPPKYIISKANIYAHGIELPPEQFAGGKETNLFLRNMGFDIRDTSDSQDISLTSHDNKKSQGKNISSATKGDLDSSEREIPGKKAASAGKHTENCSECKSSIEKLLIKVFGDVQREFTIHVQTDPSKITDPYSDTLQNIHSELVKHRGHSGFSKTGVLKVDYFVPSENLIIEFDESQHFTKPRKIALSHYPPDLKTAFPVSRWIERCDKLNKHDNSPPYRDEQRAWYDTIRDFYPAIHNMKPIIRLYAGDLQWCRLDHESPEDLATFKKMLSMREQTMKEHGPSSLFSPPQYDTGEILDALIRFEYLSNVVKIQYLIDCFEHEANKKGLFEFYSLTSKESISDEKIGGLRLLHSPYGRTFALYLNKGVYIGGGHGNRHFGHLLNECTPDQSALILELDQVNQKITRYIKDAMDWLPVFCEYMAIKTSVHELIVDVDDNCKSWGYSDLKNLEWFVRQDKTISISLLREMVVHALRIGLNPSDYLNVERGGVATDISFLAGCDYCSFMEKRDLWIDHAHWIMGQAVNRISRDRIALVMNWQKYSLCAFDCGPVYMRKKREYLVPRLCQSLADYNSLNTQDDSKKKPVYQKMHDIVSNDVEIHIGRYYDFFGPGNDTVGYFSSNKEKIDQLKTIAQDLQIQYSKLYSTIQPARR
ncbi:MAG: hypothetical protein D5R96_06840 [Methanocalculus sp. MSAO_Arc2]|uniref:hypothetical protein n=1 Tax=Methanocalculus sp. MSAO_Arc2 TaxID=2293855 RepID=UPI000FEE384E|nr:MAG: hypothetical protein D5R96_06840 [Methanocalculus sp. MSAO_Arc2]